MTKKHRKPLKVAKLIRKNKVNKIVFEPGINDSPLFFIDPVVQRIEEMRHQIEKSFGVTNSIFK